MQPTEEVLPAFSAEKKNEMAPRCAFEGGSRSKASSINCRTNRRLSQKFARRSDASNPTSYGEIYRLPRTDRKTKKPASQGSEFEEGCIVYKKAEKRIGAEYSMTSKLTEMI